MEERPSSRAVKIVRDGTHKYRQSTAHRKRRGSRCPRCPEVSHGELRKMKRQGRPLQSREERSQEKKGSFGDEEDVDFIEPSDRVHQ